MGKMITKRIKPTITSRKLYNNGRQSTMRTAYRQYEDVNPLQNAVIKRTIEEAKRVKEETENNQELVQEDTVMMDTNQKIELAAAVLADESKVKAKRIKKDKGLIERKESTIILTEDNRELLKD